MFEVRTSTVPTPEKRYQRAGSVPCTTFSPLASNLLLDRQREIGFEQLALKDDLLGARASDGRGTIDRGDATSVDFFEEVVAKATFLLEGIAGPEPVGGDQTGGLRSCLEDGFLRVPDLEPQGVVLRGRGPVDRGGLAGLRGGEAHEIDRGRNRQGAIDP